MERKWVNNGNNSNKGPEQPKESALKKLHQMEWKRNKEESMHLVRCTGDRKSKKKTYTPHQVEAGTAPASAPPQISDSPAITGRKPVNAWTQKLGSKLFSKPLNVEGDHDDGLLDLALQESLKTYVEDEERNLERCKIISTEMSESKVCDGNEYEDIKNEEDKSSSSSNKFDNQNSNNNIQFTDSDKNRIQNQRSKPAPSRCLTSGLQNKTSAPQTLKNNNSSSHEPHFSHGNPSVTNDTSLQLSNQNPNTYLVKMKNKPSLPIMKNSQNYEANKVIIIPDKDYQEDFKMNLTFGDTHGLFDAEYDSKAKLSASPENGNAVPFYHEDQKYDPVQKPFANSTPTYEGCTETDIMLHNFLRRVEPSVENRTNHLLTQNLEQNHNYLGCGTLLSNANEQDSSSSMSNSPLQNCSPLGSVDNMLHLKTGTFPMPSQRPVFYPGCIPLRNQEVNLQHASPASIPAGYTTTNPMVRSLVPGLPQYHPLVPNTAIPPQTEGYHHSLSNATLPPQPQTSDVTNSQLYKVNYQQYMAMNAQQQAQVNMLLSAQKDQASISNIGGQPQINHPQVVQQLNLPPIISQNQYVIPNSLPVAPNLIQSQSEPNITSAQVTSMNHFHQQPCNQNTGEQVSFNKGKSLEELYQHLIKCQQQVNQLQQALFGTHIQPPVQIQQTQPYGYPLQLPMGCSLPAIPGFVPQIQPQQLNTEHISPELVASQAVTGVGRLQ